MADETCQSAAPHPRCCRDYLVSAALTYKALDDGTTGQGRTVSLSNIVVVFESDRPLAIGTPIELLIAWPMTLDDEIGLCLDVNGAIGKIVDKCLTVEIQRYKFRARNLRGPVRIDEIPDPR